MIIIKRIQNLLNFTCMIMRPFLDNVDNSIYESTSLKRGSSLKVVKHDISGTYVKGIYILQPLT